MIKTLVVAGRDRARLADILQVVSRFGVAVILARLGVSLPSGDGETLPEPDSLPRRARLALEALGPTFVKLGQILATRGDLLAPAWIAELEKLHSQAPTLMFDDLRPAVELALGEPPESVFASFDPVPLAAASMAQVHRATLPGGRDVVLKIQRPGIRPLMEADLRLIAGLAAVMETNAEMRRYAPVAMVRQLAAAVTEELDFTTEGRNADRLRADFANDPRVVLPEIHWELSSETLLVMDYVDGVPPRSDATLRAAGIDPGAIAALGAELVLDMVLVNGRFHGDPHPGNLLCLPGDRIALLDLGMIGHVSPRRRQEFIGFVQSLDSGDPAQLTDVLLGWSDGVDVAPGRVRIAAERLVAKHGGGQLVLGAMIADFLPLMRHEGLVLPTDLLLVFKALVTIDGVLTAIEPGFDLSAAIRGASTKIALARLSPEYWAPIARTLAWEVSKISEDAPRLLRAAIRRLEAEPAPAVPADAANILAAGRWISGAVVIGACMVAGALLFR